MDVNGISFTATLSACTVVPMEKTARKPRSFTADCSIVLIFICKYTSQNKHHMTQLFATLLRHSCLDGHFAHLLDDFCRLSLWDIPIVTEVSMFCLLSLDLKYGWQNECQPYKMS